MKKQIRSILGERLFNYFKSAKLKYFPSAREKEALAYEKQAIEKRRLLYASLVKPGELCFDVGANVGNRIEPLLQAGAKVLAVEPQESCYKFLQWKFGDKIILITKGLSEKEEVKKFYISDASVLSTFSEEWIDAGKDRFKGHTWDKVVSVEMTTLDKLISQYGTPAFIKIDVEGFELEVLKGLSTPVKMISIEYAVPEHAGKAIDCISRMEAISPAVECNYAVGESMELALSTWMPSAQMKEHIRSEAFTKTFFGDIYIRLS